MTHTISPTPTKTPNQNGLGLRKVTEFDGITTMSNGDGFGLNTIPTGYAYKEDGIYELADTPDGDVTPTRICSPLYAKGRCRNALGSGWGRLVAVQDPDGVWHDVILDTRQLSKSQSVALAPLFDVGFELAPVSKAGDKVMALLRSWQQDTVYLRSDRLGWTSNQHKAFVLGRDEVIGNALVTTDNVSQALMSATHTKGTLDDWKKEVAARCVENQLMMLAVSHAFTGPLLSVLGVTGGGFHLRGLSSRGKSTIQYTATSVWGERSLLQSWDGTVSGFEGIAAACNDTLLNIEELHKADPKTVGDIIYMLANGQGRLRATSNGNTQIPQRWRVAILSSGEISLKDHMATGGRKTFPGQEVRLINLEADNRAHGAFDVLHGATSAKVFAERVDHACLQNYGHAGPEFVKALMRNVDSKQRLLNFVDLFCANAAQMADLSPDGQVHRVLRRFAIAALAGELATKFGLTGWRPKEAMSAANHVFLDWFEARDGTTNSELATAAQRTRDYVSKHLHNFQTIDTNDHRPVDGWRDQRWLYIRPECWCSIHGDNDPKEMARLHAQGGLLKTQSGGYQFRMGRKVPGRPRVYAIDTSKLLTATKV